MAVMLALRVLVVGMRVATLRAVRFVLVAPAVMTVMMRGRLVTTVMPRLVQRALGRRRVVAAAVGVTIRLVAVLGCRLAVPSAALAISRVVVG